MTKAVPHRHFVFSIPKILRRCFLYDRKLLSELSRYAWESLKLVLGAAVPEKDAVPGAVITIQTFGDFLGFNPHCHILATDGCFYGKGMFRVAPSLRPKDLKAILQHTVFKALLSKGEQMVRYYGYYSNVSCGRRKRENQDALIPSILEPDEDSRVYRKNWARLIRKIYEVDPLTCPQCQGQMRIVSSIRDPEVIKKILKHLGLGASFTQFWDPRRAPLPPRPSAPIHWRLPYSYQ